MTNESPSEYQGTVVTATLARTVTQYADVVVAVPPNEKAEDVLARLNVPEHLWLVQKQYPDYTVKKDSIALSGKRLEDLPYYFNNEGAFVESGADKPVFVEVRRLSGLALNWAVAYCLDEKVELVDNLLIRLSDLEPYSPTTNQVIAGAIIDNHKITTIPGTRENAGKGWTAWAPEFEDYEFTADTRLEAAMLSFVHSILGDLRIKIPFKLVRFLKEE